MINVIIVDDEEKSIAVLQELLLQSDFDVNVLASASSVEEAMFVINKNINKVDILFLDIEIIGGTSFEILQKINTEQIKIIFTTAHEEYALKAIKVYAFDFILKPIDCFELYNAVEKYLAYTSNEKSKLNNTDKIAVKDKFFERLAIPTLTDVTYLNKEDIIYFCSDKNYSTIYLLNGEKIVTSKNIGFYETILSDYGFIRIHNFYLVNVLQIKKYIKGKSGLIELYNGTKLEVALSRKKEVLKSLRLD